MQDLPIIDSDYAISRGFYFHETSRKIKSSPKIPILQYLCLCSFPDAYVKVQLMVQNKLLKSKKTEVVKRNENPEFNESFTFKLPLTSLDTANVTITAMQHQSGYKGK